jgi:hypothetical protein
VEKVKVAPDSRITLITRFIILVKNNTHTHTKRHTFRIASSSGSIFGPPVKLQTHQLPTKQLTFHFSGALFSDCCKHRYVKNCEILKKTIAFLEKLAARAVNGPVGVGLFIKQVPNILTLSTPT